MNKEKLFKYYIKSGFISDEELYGLGLSKFDSIEPQIKNLPNPVIISDLNVVTTIEDTYEEYGVLGGKSEYIAFEMQFSSMKEVVDYVIENSRYETVEITINANGKNGKHLTSIQTVQFMNDNVTPTIGNLPTPIIITDSKSITTIQDTYEIYGESGGTSEYVVFDTKFSSMKEVVDYVIENSRYETVEITINANGNNAKNVTSAQTVQFIEDSLVPVINNLPNQIITNITPLENSYVTYGNSGGTEIYTIQALSKEFSNMTDLTAFMDNRLEENKTYEENIEIKISATGNNKKTAESIQNINFIRGVKVTNETGLNTALASASPSYIQVANNITCNSAINVDGVTHKFDLNNKNISYTLSSTTSGATYNFITLGANTNLTVIDSSSEKQGSIKGKIIETAVSDGTNREATIISVNNNGILNIESGIVGVEVSRIIESTEKSNGVGVHDKGVAVQNSGTINLNGGTISSNVKTQSCTCYGIQISEAMATSIINKGTINVTSGNIITKTEAYAVRDKKATVQGRTLAYSYGIENSGTINNKENITFTTTAYHSTENVYSVSSESKKSDIK